MPAKSPEAIRQNIEKAIRRNPLFEHLTNEEYWEVSMIAARSIARVALQDVAEEVRFEKMMGVKIKAAEDSQSTREP